MDRKGRRLYSATSAFVSSCDFKGVLVSDCLSVYDDATAVQHKCYAHHLNAINKAIEPGFGS